MIEDLIRKAAAGDDDAIEKLSAIADTDPRMLAPYQGLLLDLDVLWPARARSSTQLHAPEARGASSHRCRAGSSQETKSSISTIGACAT